jgi:hypothetical protein
VKLLLDEMYPAALAESLRAASIDETTVADLGKAGSSDSELFAFAIAEGRVMLTENVVDFARIAAERSTAGEHHHGLLIALSSRFSRRPAGLRPLITAIQTVASECLDDRIVYLERPDRE